jgi:hypothetical protein
MGVLHFTEHWEKDQQSSYMQITQFISEDSFSKIISDHGEV